MMNYAAAGAALTPMPASAATIYKNFCTLHALYLAAKCLFHFP
jgi:hypothetical protein